MTVKLPLLKSGEDVISDVAEMTSSLDFSSANLTVILTPFHVSYQEKRGESTGFCQYPLMRRRYSVVFRTTLYACVPQG